MPAEFPLAAGHPLVVGFEQRHPGVSGWASRLDPGKQLDDEFVCDADVIRIAQITLQAF
jgi:hypothetical protein